MGDSKCVIDRKEFNIFKTFFDKNAKEKSNSLNFYNPFECSFTIKNS